MGTYAGTQPIDGHIRITSVHIYPIHSMYPAQLLLTKINLCNFRFSPCILTINHFYYPTNALNYIKFRDWNLCCVSFKRQLKITPTCFGSCAIHHQGVLSCAWLKLLLVVHRYFSCAWSVFGSVILNLRCVCARYDGLGTALRTVHTHRRFKITLPNTDQAHEKISVNH